MSSEKNIEEVINYWWDKANESITSAERELKSGSLSFAINRLYYSVFYAVSAALLKKGISFKKHSGVRIAFHREFIKTNLLDNRWGKFYDQLFEDRQEGDYLPLIEFEESDITDNLNHSREFLKIIQPFIFPSSK